MLKWPPFMVLALATLPTWPLLANDNVERIIGTATVVDGDTLQIDGHVIQLWSVDAPELGQTCLNRGKRWRCGLEAALALRLLVAFGKVECEKKGKDGVKVLAVCVTGDKDLGDSMLHKGYAVALPDSSPNYINTQATAKSARLGVWRGDFVLPWEWRQGVRLSADSDGAVDDCRIKGVITSENQRVFYVPSDAAYDEVKIDPERGERIFCSDDEALLAGWKRFPR